MSPSALIRLRKIAEAATKGPWEHHILGGGKGGPNRYSVRVDVPNNLSKEFAIALIHRSTKERAKANAEFIASLNPQTALALISMCEAAIEMAQELSKTDIAASPDKLWLIDWRNYTKQKAREFLKKYSGDL